MKSRLLLCAVLLAVFAVPAFADSISISFTNQGVLSGSLNSGISSVASDLLFGGTVIQAGPFATLNFDLGTFTGSLNNGGTFTGGTFELDNAGTVLFTTSFSGTWDKVGSGLYDLAGTFSTVFDGVHYSGVTDQMFKVSASTVLGTIKFNQNGDVTSNPVTIYKIKGGKSSTLKVIVPASSPSP